MKTRKFLGTGAHVRWHSACRMLGWGRCHSPRQRISGNQNLFCRVGTSRPENLDLSAGVSRPQILSTYYPSDPVASVSDSLETHRELGKEKELVDQKTKRVLVADMVVKYSHHRRPRNQNLHLSFTNRAL